MDDVELAGVIGDALQKHPKPYYAATLEESHIAFHPKKLVFSVMRFATCSTRTTLGRLTQSG